MGGSIGKNEADAAGGRVTEGILKRCTNLFVGDSNIKGDVQHLNRGLPHKDIGVEEGEKGKNRRNRKSKGEKGKETPICRKGSKPKVTRFEKRKNKTKKKIR